MHENKIYKFSELKEAIANGEFKPKFGKGYEAKTEVKENEKAVKEITDDVAKLNDVGDGQKKDTSAEDNGDLNRTTLDYRYATEPSKEYKERVKAQVHGFPSKANEDAHKKKDEELVGDVQGNEAFYDAQAKKHKKIADATEQDKEAGLKARELPKETFKDKTLFNENKKMKRLHFKHTTFLNEAQMITRIPDDYRIDGNKFIMKDSADNEYLVECVKDKLCDYVHVNVISHNCGKKALDEALAKFNRLSGYKSSDFNGGTDRRLEESQFSANLNEMRRIAEENKPAKKK